MSDAVEQNVTMGQRVPNCCCSNMHTFRPQPCGGPRRHLPMQNAPCHLLSASCSAKPHPRHMTCRCFNLKCAGQLRRRAPKPLLNLSNVGQKQGARGRGQSAAVAKTNANTKSVTIPCSSPPLYLVVASCGKWRETHPHYTCYCCHKTLWTPLPHRDLS